jgi:hypothetical protein
MAEILRVTEVLAKELAEMFKFWGNRWVHDWRQAKVKYLRHPFPVSEDGSDLFALLRSKLAETYC